MEDLDSTTRFIYGSQGDFFLSFRIFIFLQQLQYNIENWVWLSSGIPRWARIRGRLNLLLLQHAIAASGH